MLLVNTNRIVPYWTFGDAHSNAAIIDIGQRIHVDLKVCQCYDSVITKQNNKNKQTY